MPAPVGPRPSCACASEHGSLHELVRISDLFVMASRAVEILESSLDALPPLLRPRPLSVSLYVLSASAEPRP